MADWTGFRFEARFEHTAVERELLNIEPYRLSLNKLLLPQEWKRDLQNLYIVRSVHGTTAIEGNPLDEEEVGRQLLGSARPARDQVHRQTENARNAFMWIEKNAGMGGEVRLDAICAIHRLLTTGSDEAGNVPGEFRRAGHNVTVGSLSLGGVHRAPPGGPVLVDLLRRFEAFVNSREMKEQHTVVRALIAHFYFVTLHPFGNGNGRTTRCIEAAILYGGGYNTHGFYSLSNFFYRNRDDYFELLQETRTKYHYDLTRFLVFGLRGFRDELEKINAYVRNRTHRLHYRELIRRCSEIRTGKRRRLLNAREARVLHRLLDITKPADPFSDEPAKEVTFKELLDYCVPLYDGRTIRTVLRELTRLSELGFLRFTGESELDTWRVSVNFSAIERY